MYQLNNFQKPVIFNKIRSVLKYLHNEKITIQLYKGAGASLLRTIIGAPLFYYCHEYLTNSNKTEQN